MAHSSKTRKNNYQILKKYINIRSVLIEKKPFLVEIHNPGSPDFYAWWYMMNRYEQFKVRNASKKDLEKLEFRLSDSNYKNYYTVIWGQYGKYKDFLIKKKHTKKL